MTTTLLELRTRIRQRSDNEYADGKFVTDSELTSLINLSHKRLFALLAEAGLDTLAETVTDISPDGSLTYALPDDCYAVKGVFRQDNGHYLPLDRHTSRTYPRDTAEAVAYSYRTHGRLESAVIELNPRTNTGTYKVRYIGVPSELSDDADTIEGVVGWEEWIVLDCAIKVLSKEKQWESVDRLQRDLNRLEIKIDAESQERDMHNGHPVQDVRRRERNGLFDDDGFLPGGHRGVRGYWGSF